MFLWMLAEAQPRSDAPPFAAVYEGELGYVCNSLRRLGIPPKDLDDVAQDVFVTAFKRFGTYDAARPLRPWLFGIAFRTASAFRQRGSSRLEVGGEHLPEAVSEARGPDEAVAARQARDEVLRALETLDLDRKAVFVMHEIDGHTIPEVADALEIPLNTAYTRLRAARQLFVAEFRRLRGEGEAHA